MSVVRRRRASRKSVFQTTDRRTRVISHRSVARCFLTWSLACSPFPPLVVAWVAYDPQRSLCAAEVFLLMSFSRVVCVYCGGPVTCHNSCGSTFVGFRDSQDSADIPIVCFNCRQPDSVFLLCDNCSKNLSDSLHPLTRLRTFSPSDPSFRPRYFRNRAEPTDSDLH